MNRRHFALAALAALSACASLPPGAPTTAGWELLEPLAGVRADTEGVTIQVRSRGCTIRGDFAFYVERKGPIPTLAFGRRRVDACAGPAAVMEIAFSWMELGLTAGEPVLVVNPLAPQAPSTPFSTSSGFSSPAWNISRTMSAPPTNSPFT